MFKCQCGAPVRAIYCPDENQYEPDDVCERCHIEEEQDFNEDMKTALILQQREEMKKRMQELDANNELPF